MTLADGWAYALINYAQLQGRARRTEFFSFGLLQMGWYLAILVTQPWSFSEVVVGVLVILSGLFFFVPNLSVTVRRLHDVGLSGWFVFLIFVPFGQFVLLLLACIPPQDGARAYGPDPRDG